MNTEFDFDPMFLTRAVSGEMLARLEWMTLKPKIIVDWRGGGELTKHFAGADVLTSDESVSQPAHSVDLIFANLIFPWTHDLKKLLHTWRRLLRPEGVLLFSSLGPDTLKELRQFTEVLPKFVDMHDIGDALTHARFADPVLDAEYLTVTYRELPKLLNELQMMDMIEKNINDLSLQKHNNVFSLTFEIIYGHAFGPSLTVDNVADDEGIVKIPLAHLRRKK